MLTLISSICNFNNSNSVFNIAISVLALPIDCAIGVKSGADTSDKASSFVVISPYLTNPPPIATIAAINAAIPAS